MPIYIVGCSKRKLHGRHEAQDLYSMSPFFNKCLAFAKMMARKASGSKDHWKGSVFILSAKLGLVEPDTVIDHYDQKMTPSAAKKLAMAVRRDFKLQFEDQSIVMVCGELYRGCIRIAFPKNKKYNFFNGCKGIGECHQKIQREIEIEGKVGKRA